MQSLQKFFFAYLRTYDREYLVDLAYFGIFCKLCKKKKIQIYLVLKLLLLILILKYLKKCF